jgi:hypothetical protein
MKSDHLQIRFKQLGTENLIRVFVAIFTVSNDLRILFRDFTIAKLIAFAVGLIEYAGLINAGRQALHEFKQLTPDKAREIEQEVRKRFNIGDQRFEAALEDALELVVDTYEWVQDGAFLGRRYVEYYHKYISGKDGAENRHQVPGQPVYEKVA